MYNIIITMNLCFDALMLMYLLPGNFTNEQMKRAYEYYEPITTHNSSLSTAIHAIIATRLGKMPEASTYFHKSCAIDLDPGKKGCEEGIHIANAGGQAVIHEDIRFGVILLWTKFNNLLPNSVNKRRRLF